MVTNTLQTISKAEKEMERLAGASSNTQDPADQASKEMRRLAEMATFSALKATEQWGKKALEKSKEHKEEIII